MMKKLKLSYCVIGVIHVCPLHMLSTIHFASEDNYIVICAAHLQSCTEKHPSTPFPK